MSADLIIMCFISNLTKVIRDKAHLFDNTMESTTIKALFGRRNIRFIIPAYQRAYTWDKRQFSQFREDLQECAGSDYYLGHFLFEQDGDTFYVIDGQQRLTTSIIFCSENRNGL